MRNIENAHNVQGPRLVICCCLSILGLILSGCAEYSFDINDNEIYSPPVLYTNFSVEDPALQDCILQTVRDNQVTAATDLLQLQCSHSGIQSISGVSHFSRLRQLGLKGNQLSDIEELLQLTYLEYLDLSGNPIQDCQTIEQLQSLLDNNLNHSSACN